MQFSPYGIGGAYQGLGGQATRFFTFSGSWE